MNIPTFEQYLAEEDTASLSHKGHTNKPGDKTMERLPKGNDDGSNVKDEVERTADLAPGDSGAEALKEC